MICFFALTQVYYCEIINCSHGIINFNMSRIVSKISNLAELGIMSKENKKSQEVGSQSIEDFEITKKLGEGAYSSVFRVTRKEDGLVYALKKVKMKNLCKKQKENALNEVRILASIAHKNIIAFKQTFYQKNHLYIVMEYADNGDLYSEISNKRKKNQKFTEEEIWSYMLQICSALYTLHKANVIHRDLKSANIFLMKNGEIKLGDMNVSKIAKLCETQTGTPYYASPEVWMDIPYDCKSDMWSLGCVIYEMITFSPPFKAEDLQGLFRAVTQQDCPELPNDVSKQMNKIIGILLQKDPKNRYSAQKILQNILRLVPEAFHKNPIISELITTYTNIKKSKNNKMQQLLKEITFPMSKKHKMSDLQINSYLPSPSYNSFHKIGSRKQDSSLQQIPVKQRPSNYVMPLDVDQQPRYRKKNTNSRSKHLQNKNESKSIAKIYGDLSIKKIGLPSIDRRSIHAYR